MPLFIHCIGWRMSSDIQVMQGRRQVCVMVCCACKASVRDTYQTTIPAEHLSRTRFALHPLMIPTLIIAYYMFSPLFKII